MLHSWTNYRKSLRIIMVILPFVIGLMVTVVVFATPSPVINTNDGVIDPNWGAPLFTQTCPAVPTTNDISNAWIQSNSNEIYFSLQTCVGPAIGGTHYAAALMDCDMNGSVNTTTDRWILYQPVNDYQDLRDGNKTTIASQCTGAIGTPCEYGERINDTLEWRVDYSILSTDPASALPAGCRGQINIAFGVVNVNTGTLITQTTLKGFNVPTVVHMKEIKASSQPGETLLVVGLVGVILAAGLGAVVILRRKNRIS